MGAVRMRDCFDVFVIGGGPAGLAAAIAARRKGMNVAVADGATPPIDKTCGEGMLPETLQALRSLGVNLNCAEGIRFLGIRFIQEGLNCAAPFPSGFGLALRRPLLHQRLITAAAECGVELLWKTPVTGIGSREVFAGGRTYSVRWIVGADGLGS